MADTTRTVDIIFKGKNQVTPAVTGIENSLEDISTEAANAENSVDGLGDELQGLKGGEVIVNKIGLAFSALAGSVVAQQFFDANASYENFIRSLEFSVGSLEAAQREFEFIRDLSNEFGVEMLSTADSFSKFIASTRSSGLELTQLKGIFETVTASLSAVGAPAADISGALLQLSQGIGRGSFELEDLKGIVERLPGGMGLLADAIDRTVKETRNLVTAQKFGNEEILLYAQRLNQDLGRATFDSLTNRTARLKNSLSDLNLAIGDLGVREQLGDNIQFAANAVGLLADGIDKAGGKTEVFRAAASGLGPLYPVYQLLASGVEAVSNQFGSANDELKEVEVTAKRIPEELQEITVSASGIIQALPPIEKVSKGLTETAKEANRTKVALEEIASNERIKAIEAKVSLNIAELETQSQVAIATIETLGESIQGTADLLGGLFGNLGSADSLREKFQIEKQIETENKRRQEQLELQEKLTNAQIREINARTAALRKGDATIKVNGDGLQPHLEAFMFEILEAIQVRVNSDGLQQLLGT